MVYEKISNMKANVMKLVTLQQTLVRAICPGPYNNSVRKNFVIISIIVSRVRKRKFKIEIQIFSMELLKFIKTVYHR